jgi:hypothetical protein
MRRWRPSVVEEESPEGDRKGIRWGRPALVLATGLVVAAVGALALLAAPWGRAPGAAHFARMSKKVPRASQRLSLPITTVNGTTTYQPESISVSAPPAGYTAPVSSSAVLASFDEQVIPQNILGSTLTSGTPAATLNSVTDNRTDPPTQFTGWVVVYHDTVPQSYGLTAVPTAPDCDFVGVFNLESGQWTDFFQNCPS